MIGSAALIGVGMLFEPELLGGALIGVGVVYELPLVGQVVRPIATTAVQFGYAAAASVAICWRGSRPDSGNRGERWCRLAGAVNSFSYL